MLHLLPTQKTADKSQLNSWQLLKVAEDVRWSLAAPTLYKLDVFISAVECVCVCVFCGVLSHTHSSLGGQQQRSRTEQNNPLLFLFFCAFFLPPAAPADEPPGRRGSVRERLDSDDAPQLSNSVASSSHSLLLSHPLLPLVLRMLAALARCPLLTSFEFVLMTASTHSPTASPSLPSSLSSPLSLLSCPPPSSSSPLLIVSLSVSSPDAFFLVHIYCEAEDMSRM